MKFLAILVLALATACAYETPVPFREVPFDAESEGRIIGGTAAKTGEIIYQLGLSINGGSWCGASLISQNYALTAAHCTSGLKTGTIYAGSVTRTGGTAVDFTSANVIQHTGYNPSTIANDISLIRLPKALTLGTNIGVVKLAAASAGTYAGTVALISGWGKTTDSSAVASALQKANVNVITNSVCAQTYGTTSINSGTICAETKTTGTSTCNGDSGGPMVASGEQIGVVSFGSSAGCAKGYAVAFSRVSAFRTWILTNSGV